MIAAVLLALLIVSPTTLAAAVTVVPDTPGAFMLPEVPTYAAVVADVDGDSIRDLVRLVDAGDQAIVVEAWRIPSDGPPERIGEPITVAPSGSDGEPGELVFAGSPTRLVVRRIDGVDRATLVRQPRFEEPALEVDCCLLLHDVVERSGRLELVEVSEHLAVADAVLAIDMDGDDTDELLITRSLTPIGDTTFPIEARLLRWSGARFDAPTMTALGVGSGFSPFVLGDSDGVSGDEAGLIAVQSRLHRISLRGGDVLVAESAEAGTRDAVAVPIPDGRGVATISLVDGTTVRHWPRDGALGEPLASAPIFAATIVGPVERDADGAGLAIRRSESLGVALLDLPGLTQAAPPLRDEVARTLSQGPVQPFVGPVAGGDREGSAAVALGGSLVVGGALVPSVPMAGVVPIGLVGPGRQWLALSHGALDGSGTDPRSSRLSEPIAPPGSGVSIVPLARVLDGQDGDGVVEPPVTGVVENSDQLLVGAGGFVASVVAPPGARVYVSGDGPEPDVAIVPADGELAVAVRVPPPDDAPIGPRSVRLAVVTPGGQGYLATWQVRVDDAPELVARAATGFGSSSVTIRGRATPGATISVAGRPISVERDGAFETSIDLPPWPSAVDVVATDPLGRAITVVVVGVGWFDYRGLPWLPIAAVALAVAGGLLVVRGARANPAETTASDAGILEEIDPEEL